jgi:polysaccharide pyruvyl transferase WcaK-like protein
MQLKAIAGLADGVLTGRMHLAIASLGMGVPVVALTYQGKFEGLFRHFDLPSWLLLSPAQTLRPGLLEQTLERFIDELPSLRTSVAAHWPTVLAASQRNLANLL